MKKSYLLAIFVTLFTSIASAAEKPVIYQLFVRTFGASENSRGGVGTFKAVSDKALDEIKKMGVNIVWLTGVMEHASPLVDDADVVKGTAGSPYAVRDYYDTHFEYGSREDFKSLVSRIHSLGMKAVIDLVPNHTARNNIVDVPGKENMGFGIADDPSKFFDINNNFFYIKPDAIYIPPARFLLSLMNSNLGINYDGVFDRDINIPGIQYEYPAKVSGDNIMVANPDFNTWFETAKLNYGYDFRQGGGHHYPRNPLSVPFDKLPSTWKKMIDIMVYWLDMGVDGFRIDIANMVPVPFWEAAFHYSRLRHPEAFFMMEAYESENGDPVEYSHQKMFLAGADAIYSQPVYDAAKAVYLKGDNATGIGTQVDKMLAKIDGPRQAGFVFYVENHDQVRASSKFFRKENPGPEYALTLSRFLFGLPGMFMIYNGQEVAEAGDPSDGKTSIFDYAYMPSIAAWANNGNFDGQGLSKKQKELRTKYADLFAARKLPAVAAPHSRGNLSYVNLNVLNRYDYRFDKNLSAYARFSGDDRYVMVGNFHPTEAQETTVHFTSEYQDVTGVMAGLGIKNSASECWRFKDLFTGFVPIDPNSAEPGTVTGKDLWKPYGIPSGLYLGKVPPLTVYYLKAERCN